MLSRALPKSALEKRLAPLYVGAFFQGFVLWYAIEKLFMFSIGFNAATLGAVIAAYAAVMLLAETPSGILADRWSRKGVLILASICLAVSSVIMGFSVDIPTFTVGALFWGIFYAFYTGTYDSVVYDTLIEERGNGDGYERYYGRVKVVDGTALVIGSLLGGVVSEVWGLREVYFLSAPLALISISALWAFSEPQLHKAEVAASLGEHVVHTFRAISHTRELWRVVALLLIMTAAIEILFEFSQVWLIAIAAPTVIFGVANALVLSTLGIGGFLAGRLALNRRRTLVAIVIAILGSTVGLIIFRHAALIIAAQTILGIAIALLDILFMRLLHADLPSRYRAGASSAVSTIARLVFIPGSLLFGWLSEELSVFTATGLLLAMFVVMSLLVWRTATTRNLASVDTGFTA